MTFNIEKLKIIAECIATQFGSNTEVVIHDYSNGFDSTIKHIENGHVTNRKIGGCPTSLFLKELKEKSNKSKNFRYITNTQDGKTLRSSTVNFFDNDNNLCGSLCINQDISDLILLDKATRHMAAANMFEIKNLTQSNELHSTSIQDLLESLITEGITTIGVSVNEMNKESKMKLIEFLDAKGAFLIQKSALRIYELLDISKFTFYKYLDEVRARNQQ